VSRSGVSPWSSSRWCWYKFPSTTMLGLAASTPGFDQDEEKTRIVTEFDLLEVGT
jgi:hypothetical protein